MRGAGLTISLLALAAGISAAQAADPMARLCAGYGGLPKGFGAKPTAGMVRLDGGAFRMGSDDFYPEESPVREATVGPFWIDRHEVTNAEFAAFVAATGYRTVAERGIDPARYPGLPEEMTAPGGMVFTMPKTPAQHIRPGTWWTYTPGADWRHPTGPESGIAGRDNEPVVQIAWADAKAYADWLGRDLPTEAEWEFAARGGAEGLPYAWGADPVPDERHRANAWQGVFPVYDEAADGFHGVAPVGCYEPNPFGLFDMMGNVWEWSSDAWTAGHVDPAPDSTGPVLAAGEAEPFAVKVIKGGSWLCSDTFCGRYRPAARQPHEVDLGSSHVGFRTVLREK
jgi:sulfatase modifying factor 1